MRVGLTVVSRARRFRAGPAWPRPERCACHLRHRHPHPVRRSRHPWRRERSWSCAAGTTSANL